jgi:hypothetical protein
MDYSEASLHALLQSTALPTELKYGYGDNENQTRDLLYAKQAFYH